LTDEALVTFTPQDCETSWKCILTFVLNCMFWRCWHRHIGSVWLLQMACHYRRVLNRKVMMWILKCSLLLVVGWTECSIP